MTVVAISVVIPCYRSEKSLPELLPALTSVLEAIGTYEIILVHDCGPDQTWAVITALAARHPQVRAFNLSRNYGQHNALLCGISQARGEVVVTMDDDLQHPPSEIPILLEALGNDKDLVYGIPKEEKHGVFRDLASITTKSALSVATGNPNVRNASAFRAFRGHLVALFTRYHGTYVAVDVLLSWGTNRITAVPVDIRERKHGASGYNFRQLVRSAFNILTGFSVAPLRLASYLGFGFTALGFVLLAYVLINFLVHGAVVQGFTFIAAAVAMFSGVQLFCLGIIGEYLARMYYRTMDRPPYLVRDRIDATDPPLPAAK